MYELIYLVYSSFSYKLTLVNYNMTQYLYFLLFLFTGDCDMAICGGVNIILSPMNYIILNKARMISKTGKSQTFSADADGYARGEGCGMVILKNFKKVHILNFLITVNTKIIMCAYIKYIDYWMLTPAENMQ